MEGVGKRDDCSYLKNREPSNDDGSENVAKKLNLPYFKCYRVYLELLNLSNVGSFVLELNSYGLYSGSERKRRIRRRMFTFFIKRCITRFHSIVVRSTSKKCTKKLDACAATVVSMLKPIGGRGGSDFDIFFVLI